MSSMWFNCTEPSLSTSLQGKQDVQGAYALVHAHRNSSNLLKPYHCRDGKVCRVFYMRSVWFNCTKPSLSTSLKGKQGVQDAYAFKPARTTVWLREPSLQVSFTWVRGGSVPSNRLKPPSRLIPPRTHEKLSYDDCCYDKNYSNGITIQVMLIIQRESLLSLTECCLPHSKSSSFNLIVKLWLLDAVVFNYPVDTDCHFILSEGVFMDDFSFNHSSLGNWYFTNRVKKCD